MDRHKSGLKGEGLVMPGTANWPDKDDIINNDGIIGAGDPAYLIGSHSNKKVASLDETKRDMYAAQTHLTNVMNSLLHSGEYIHEDLETLASVSTAITKGINFLEHIEAVLTTMKEVTDGWKEDPK